ncbi:hypothetical protein [Thiomonas sp. FB-Cd]|uniref:hypothetical protein n=1 Tax=Thiomonas sp. FB-Cd TaxID=1158292 RepID=UPI0004DEF3B2|nr:hypothetical protein [Thiomonas sp. FB-Cd]
MTALLIDNDIVIKLARMDVFNEGVHAIGYSSADLGSLAVMLRYMGQLSEARRLQLTHSKEEADRLHAALQSITVIEPTDAETRTIAKVGKLAVESGLDLQEGELMLAVIAVSRGNLRIATGDKRALRSLPALETRWLDAGALRRQLYCLEQIFKSICATLGLQRVRAAVNTSPRADETIRFAYDNMQMSGKTAFIAFLDLVIKEHVEKPAPGWLA